MIISGKVYDSYIIRKTAGKLRTAARETSETGKSKVRHILSELSGDFQGEAAKELVDKLNALEKNILSTSSAIDQIAARLEAAAVKLEQIDKESATLVRRN